MFYKIISCTHSVDKLFIPQELYSSNTFVNLDSITIHAGLREQDAKIVLLPELPKDTIMLSENIFKTLLLVPNILYQIKCTNDRIDIGPVIGLLIRKKHKMLMESLDSLFQYTTAYPQINGILCAFSLEGLDINAQSVKGFFFNPNTNSWEGGNFPLPNAIYRRIPLSSSLSKKLKAATKNRIFNSKYFDKWRFWKTACKNIYLRPHLPETKRLFSLADIDKMFKKYDVLYLKPARGLRGIGIIRVVKNQHCYCFQTKYGTKPFIFSSKKTAAEYINYLTSKHKYLVQQGIHALKFDERYTNVRVDMKKNETLAWQCISIGVWFGMPGGNSSNYDDDTYALSYEAFCEKFFPLHKQQMLEKKEEILEVCKKACEMLDTTGENYGEIGIDLVLDNSLKAWILEINNRWPGFQLLLHTKDQKGLRNFYEYPIKYAAALSGFPCI